MDNKLAVITDQSILKEKESKVQDEPHFVVINEQTFEQCTLKQHHRLKWFWRLIDALHECGHALSKFPCVTHHGDPPPIADGQIQKKESL